MGFHRQYSNFLSLRQQKRLALDHALTSLDFTPADPQMDYSKAQTLSIIAQLFDFLNDKRRAREYINKAIKLTEARGFKYRGEVASFNSIILLSENKEDEALAELEKSISYYTDIKFYDKLLETRAKIGHIYFKRKDYKQAESEYNKIITLQKEHDIGSIGKSSLLLEAKLLKLRGDIPKAIEKYNDILDLATESNTPSLILSAYKGLSNIYMSTNQLKKGIVYSEKYHQLKDSIFLNDQNKEVLALEASYDREKKEQQIQVLDTQNKLQTVQLSSQRKLLFTSLGFISIVLLISGLLYRLFRKVKSQNKVIEKTLGEKDLLLKEIHHRVKNNLQLVSSLLTLQSKEIEDKKAIEAINAGKSRVRSMALIHQDLYSRDNLKSISVKKYLDNLCKELFHTYNINESKIQLSLEIQDLYLDIDSIIPLGLIINELITNSLKYAFVSKDSGNLSIKITENSKQLVLTVKDDGTGFDPQAFENSNSFGNKLIKTLSEQLDGKITYHAAEGAEIQINFNDYKIAS
jgi:two-component sensor histidine kinase